MQIEQVNLREKLEQARLSFDSQLAEVLVGRPDLSRYLDRGVIRIISRPGLF